YNLRNQEAAVTESGTIQTFIQSLLPRQYVLHQNYPNPFNPITTLRFEMPQESEAALVIYNLLGQEVARLHDSLHEGPLAAGYHEVMWNGRDDQGQNLSSGLYFARFVTPAYTKTIKLLLLK
ncbi:FlgD immunoglobulin-like domain containing protein, partial [Candidatus Neomarinimicrobiota bacterium]